MKRTRILAFLAVLVLLVPATIFAQQPLPHRFAGSVTLDGAPAKDGTNVGAVVDGKEVAATTTTGGNYRVDVAPPESVSFGGKTVSFTVGGNGADQSAKWESGGATVLDLTARRGAPVPQLPTPTPTSAPASTPPRPPATPTSAATPSPARTDTPTVAPAPTRAPATAALPPTPKVVEPGARGKTIAIIVLIVGVVGLVVGLAALFMGRTPRQT